VVELLNDIARHWWEWTASMFWQVGLLILVIACLDLLVRKWAWPQLRYALWSLILVKLILPPTLSLPSAVVPELRPRVAVALRWMNSDKPAVAERSAVISNLESQISGLKVGVGRQFSGFTVSAGDVGQLEDLVCRVPVRVSGKRVEGVPPSNRGQDARDTTPYGVTTNAVLGQNTERPASALGSLSSVPLIWQFHVMMIWFFGTLILGIWLVLRLHSVAGRQGYRAAAASLPQSFYNHLADCAKRLGLRRIPRVAVTRRLTSPAVFGVLSPVLLVPKGYLSKLSRRDTEHMLLHELAHIKRGDLVMHSLHLLLQVVYWYNPLLWLVRRHLHDLRELSCDGTVAELLREQTPAYRQTLLETARRMLTTSVEPGLGLLGLFEDSNHLLARLNWLTKPTWRYCTMKRLIVATLAILMFACVLPMAQGQDPSPIREGPAGVRGPGPWDNDVLVYQVGRSGQVTQIASFARAGVPTLARLKDGRLIAAHQYFPEKDEASFDKVAVRFSADEGQTWSAPQVIQVAGLPEGMRFPFDPTLVPLSDGRVRLYFTGNLGRAFGPSAPAIHSAISTDGVNYTYEPGVRFGVEGRMVIDCAVVLHSGVFHLYVPDNGTPMPPGPPRSPSAADRPREGVAYHATSKDGLDFTRVDDVQIAGRRRWLGNAQSDGQVITFCGTGQPGGSVSPDRGQPRGGVWLATSTDGQMWKLLESPPIPGADPGLVATREGGWIVVVTGPPRPGTPSERSFRDRPPQGAPPVPPGPPGGDGPWNHRVMLATSTDGLTWKVSDEVLAEQASVPELFAGPSGRPIVLFVDASGRSQRGGLGAMVRQPDGKWMRASTNLRGADPSVVQLKDGTYRAYTKERDGSIRALSSTDGLNWRPLGEAFRDERYPQATDPDVFETPSGWVMLVSLGPRLLRCTSSDGLKFVAGDVADLGGSVSDTVVVKGGWRTFFHVNANPQTGAKMVIRSAFTADGRSWRVEEGDRVHAPEDGPAQLGVADPTPLPLPDGTWLMAVKSFIGPSRPGTPSAQQPGAMSGPPPDDRPVPRGTPRFPNDDGPAPSPLVAPRRQPASGNPRSQPAGLESRTLHSAASFEPLREPWPIATPFNELAASLLSGRATAGDQAQFRQLAEWLKASGRGPWFDEVRVATSTDGFNFTDTRQAVLGKASVPEAVVDKDGNVWLFFVDADLDRWVRRIEAGAPLKTGLMSLGAAKSADGFRFERVEMEIKNVNVGKNVDPDIVVAADGTYHLYYLGVPASELAPDTADPARAPSPHKFYLATSRDLVHWEQQGVAWTGPHGGADPAVYRQDAQTWFILGGGAGRSADGGKTFHPIEMTTGRWGQPDVIAADGGFRLFYSTLQGIRSAFSKDGVNWSEEDGVRLRGGADPSVVRMQDGSWRMYYKVGGRSLGVAAPAGPRANEPERRERTDLQPPAGGAPGFRDAGARPRGLPGPGVGDSPRAGGAPGAMGRADRNRQFAGPMPRGEASTARGQIRVEKIDSKYKVASGAKPGTFVTGQDADLMLGGFGFNNTGGALQFNHPTGLASDGQMLLMTDRWNNRVLVWKSAPAANTPPDLVLGQPDFTQNDPGKGRNQMNWPGNVAITPDGRKIAVTDTNNDRILIWNSFPTTSGAAADCVLDLTQLSGGSPPQFGGGMRFGWPWGVWTDGRKLAVVATHGSAVLIWNAFPMRDNQPPDLVLRPSDAGTPRNVTSDGNWFAVSDHNNRPANRPATMVWRTFPTSNTQEPDFKWGEWMKGTFTPDRRLVLAGMAAIWIWNQTPSSEATRPEVELRPAGYRNGDGPDAVVANGRLYICNYNGNNLLVWNSLPTRDNQPPDFSIGSATPEQDVWAENFFIQNPVVATDGRSLFISSDFDRKLFVWRQLPDESAAKPDLVFHLSEAPWDNALHGRTLALAGKSTVVVWRQLPLDGEQPDLVLSGSIGSVRLGELTGVALDDKYFYLSDRQSDSIHVWEGIPSRDQEPKFTLPMRSPGHLNSDGTYLAAAPFEGQTILLWRVGELGPGAQATSVGAPGRFNLPGQGLVAQGHLFVADRGFNRVHVWHRVEDALAGQAADALLGAANDQDRDPEIGRNKLFSPGSLAFDRGYLWVGEFKFSTRVLRFSPKP